MAELKTARSIVEVVAIQNRYNLLEREDDDLVELSAQLGICFIPYAPLGGGSSVGSSTAVARVATARGATPAQVALAWLLARSPVMLPIPGTSSVAHMEEDLAAASLRLDSDELRALNGAGGGARRRRRRIMRDARAYKRRLRRRLR